MPKILVFLGDFYKSHPSFVWVITSHLPKDVKYYSLQNFLFSSLKKKKNGLSYSFPVPKVGPNLSLPLPYPSITQCSRWVGSRGYFLEEALPDSPSVGGVPSFPSPSLPPSYLWLKATPWAPRGSGLVANGLSLLLLWEGLMASCEWMNGQICKWTDINLYFGCIPNRA